jgi:hypothetical protein
VGAPPRPAPPTFALPALAPPLLGVVPAIPEAEPPFPPEFATPPLGKPLDPALAIPPLPPVDGELCGSAGGEHPADTTVSARNEQSAPDRPGRRVKGIGVS